MNQTRCIVKKETFNTEDLKQLNDIQKHFNWDDATLEAKIGTWQTINNRHARPPAEIAARPAAFPLHRLRDQP